MNFAMIKLMILCGMLTAFALGGCPRDDGVCQAGQSDPDSDAVSLLAVKTQLRKAAMQECSLWAPENHCTSIQSPNGQKTGFCNFYWKWSPKGKYGLTGGEVVMCRNTEGVFKGCRAQSALKRKIQSCIVPMVTEINDKCEAWKARRIPNVNQKEAEGSTPLSGTVAIFMGEHGACDDLGPEDCKSSLEVPLGTQETALAHTKKMLEAKRQMSDEEMRRAMSAPTVNKEGEHVEGERIYSDETIAKSKETLEGEVLGISGILEVITFLIKIVDPEQNPMDYAQFEALRELLGERCAFGDLSQYGSDA